MVAASTLKKYIDRCENVLSTSDKQEARNLIKEIVTVFRTEYNGITHGLEMYSRAMQTSYYTRDYLHDIELLQARLQKELEALEFTSSTPKQLDEHGKKLFISHATNDKEYVDVLVKLFESLGFREDDIICSSIPPYCIPLDNNVYEWLANEFQHSDIHMIFALSKTYYTRPTCLNEMGAAWAMKHKWTGLLLPGFDFSEIAGCIDPSQVSIKLDDNDKATLIFRLGELKDNLIEEFELRPVSPEFWERKRNDFIKQIDEVTQKKRDKALEEIDQDNTRATLEMEDMILLVYSVEKGNGQIMMTNSIARSGVLITIQDLEFPSEDSARESARWKSSLENLERIGLIEKTGTKGYLFVVTDQGYKEATRIQKKCKIDTDKNPYEYLK